MLQKELRISISVKHASSYIHYIKLKIKALLAKNQYNSSSNC
jgi:hypothetical protein